MTDRPSLRVEGVVKRYGSVEALKRVSVNVRQGEFVTILGPSGSGKTTFLKIIAGFEFPDEGAVSLEGRDITHAAPGLRNIGMVFQNYALFPHMTVAENVAFPLRMRRVARTEAKERVRESLALVELAGYEQRYPNQLSGGQQQRVALARAVVFRPPLLLLDEPFGALDRKLREQMQLEVRRLQRRLGLTALFVTHDQEEALLMSDRIVIMDQGEVQQVGGPEEIYTRPGNRFVADFIGESNLFDAEVLAVEGREARLGLAAGRELFALDAEVEPGERVHVVIRPESPAVSGEGENRLDMVVVEAAFTGSAHRYRLRSAEGLELIVRRPREEGAPPLQPDETVAISIARAAVRVVR